MLENKLQNIIKKFGKIDIKPKLFDRIRDEKSKIEFVNEYESLITFGKIISLAVMVLSLMFNFYRFVFSQYFENAKLAFENFDILNLDQILTTVIQFLIGFFLYISLSVVPFASYLTLKNESR